MKLLPDIALVIFAAFFCYAIGGFVSMRWDVVEWTPYARVALVFAWIFVSCFSISARRFQK